MRQQERAAKPPAALADGDKAERNEVERSFV